MALLELLRQERSSSVDTLRMLGPDADTLCQGWQARHIAAHLAMQDQSAGLPVLLSAPIALPFLRFGVRAPSKFAQKFEGQLEKLAKRDWIEVLNDLGAGPPRSVAMPVLAPMRLHENWIHHEDLRRSAGAASRPSSPAVDNALWKALKWYGPYQRKVLSGIDLLLRSPSGDLLRLGDPDGEEVEAAGPAGELALLISGRAHVSEAKLEGSEAGPRSAAPTLSLIHI